ncbi:MAG: hypothetical protein A2167_01035 [Planctomycetes bacterium RBG_13_46_10]|nr:MAG: hypothetical protein A2167_01035 [Planctomycetes bacterium RBG_13_46_10]
MIGCLELIVRKAIAIIRAEGPQLIPKYIAHRISDRYYDWRLGISTCGSVESAELGIRNPMCRWYSPTDYRSFRKVMRHFKIRDNRDVFLDYGAGKGRVLIMAAAYPFRRIIGIEIAPQLVVIAKQNIQRARRKLSCNDIWVLTADAASYAVSPEVTFVYGYHSFVGETLSKVLRNIRHSLIEAPRELTIIWKNIGPFEEHVKHCDWLVKYGEFPCYAGHKYGVYKNK